MPPIEMGPSRPVGAVDVRNVRLAGGAAKQAARGGEAPVVKTDVLDPGAPPIDAERVAMVRKAVEQGTYPVIPAKVADAMIAAGILLRSGK